MLCASCGKKCWIETLPGGCSYRVAAGLAGRAPVDSAPSARVERSRVAGRRAVEFLADEREIIREDLDGSIAADIAAVIAEREGDDLLRRVLNHRLGYPRMRTPSVRRAMLPAAAAGRAPSARVARAIILEDLEAVSAERAAQLASARVEREIIREQLRVAAMLDIITRLAKRASSVELRDAAKAAARRSVCPRCKAGPILAYDRDSVCVPWYAAADATATFSWECQACGEDSTMPDDGHEPDDDVDAGIPYTVAVRSGVGGAP